MNPSTNLFVAILIIASPWMLRWVKMHRLRVLSDRERLRRVTEISEIEARAEVNRLFGQNTLFRFAPITPGWLMRLRPKVPAGLAEIWDRHGAPLLWAKLPGSAPMKRDQVIFARVAPHVLQPADKKIRRVLSRYGAEGPLYRIGYHGSDALVFATPASETIFEVGGLYSEADLPDEFLPVRQFPSIYHWLLSLVPPEGGTLLRPADPAGPDALMRPTAQPRTRQDELLRPTVSDPDLSLGPVDTP